jgi:hypothetical protein
MKCSQKSCQTEAHYIVTNPVRNVQSQLDTEHWYCLRHARTTFRDDCTIFTEKDGPIQVYKITLEWSRKATKGEKNHATL